MDEIRQAKDHQVHLPDGQVTAREALREAFDAHNGETEALSARWPDPLRLSSTAAVLMGLSIAVFALLLRYPLIPFIGLTSPFLTFHTATIVAAYTGGNRAGVAATVAGGLMAVFFLQTPIYSFQWVDRYDLFGFIIFEMTGLAASILIEYMHRARAKVQSIAKSLQATQEELHSLNQRLEKKVTERTEDLNSALKWFQSIMAHLPVAAVAQDAEGRIITVNKLFVKLWQIGVSPEELFGQRISVLMEVLRPKVQDGDAFLSRLQSVQRERKQVLSQEIRLMDGRFFLQDYVPIIGKDRHIGHLLLFRDITQERRLDRAKTEFMGLASHQLRTPLTAIRWMMGRLQKLLAGKLDEPVGRLLEQGKLATARMSRTIDDILSISKIESGEIEMSSRMIKVSELLAQVADAFKGEADAKQLSVSVICDEGIVVSSDERYVFEVLSILLSNAVKYTSLSGYIILHGARREGRVEMSVEDSGYGIPRHEQERVFQKFFRGSNVVTRDTEGTGLGLYLASLIAELLSGSISFRSDEESGSVFTLTLPQPATTQDPEVRS